MLLGNKIKVAHAGWWVCLATNTKTRCIRMHSRHEFNILMKTMNPTWSLRAVWSLQEPGSPEFRERNASGCHQRASLVGSGLVRAESDKIKKLFCCCLRYMQKESHIPGILLKHSTNIAYQGHWICWLVPKLWESICKKKKHKHENVLDVHIQLVSIYDKKKKSFNIH